MQTPWYSKMALALVIFVAGFSEAVDIIPKSVDDMLDDAAELVIPYKASCIDTGTSLELNNADQDPDHRDSTNIDTSGILDTINKRRGPKPPVGNLPPAISTTVTTTSTEDSLARNDPDHRDSTNIDTSGIFNTIVDRRGSKTPVGNLHPAISTTGTTTEYSSLARDGNAENRIHLVETPNTNTDEFPHESASDGKEAAGANTIAWIGTAVGAGVGAVALVVFVIIVALIIFAKHNTTSRVSFDVPTVDQSEATTKAETLELNTPHQTKVAA